eukprot:3894198-Rhodomonas_salina.2
MVCYQEQATIWELCAANSADDLKYRLAARPWEIGLPDVFGSYPVSLLTSKSYKTSNHTPVAKCLCKITYKHPCSSSTTRCFRNGSVCIQHRSDFRATFHNLHSTLLKIQASCLNPAAFDFKSSGGGRGWGST